MEHTSNSVNFEKYRELQAKNSRVLWGALNHGFDLLKIPGDMRSELMHMSPEMYLAWGRDERILPREKIHLAVRYLQLFRAMDGVFGEHVDAMHTWLFSGNNGHRHIFRGRSPIETMIEDGEHAVDAVTETLRTP